MAVPAAFADAAVRLAPGLGEASVAIDYATRTGSSIWDSSTKAMDPKYNLTQDRMEAFIDKIQQQCNLFGWGAMIITINIAAAGQPANNINLLTQYAQVTIAQAMAAANFYAGQETLITQHSFQFANYLLNSLTEEASLFIMAREPAYTVKGHATGIP